MITWPDVSTQMNWAQEDGFNPLDPTCHTCGQAVLEGDDCDKWHYRLWLLARMGES